MGLDTTTYWLTDRQSQCDFDFDFERELREYLAVKDEKFGWRLIVSYCNLLWLREIIKEGVSKSNHPIENPLLLVTEP
jgi:hypothetical protein